jgi:hypothetical protein
VGVAAPLGDGGVAPHLFYFFFIIFFSCFLFKKYGT